MWDNLTMAQKNELMKTYIKAGIKDLPSIINHYNSFSDGGTKKTYKEWVSAMASKYPWLEMNSANAGYDYERYFNENYQDAISRLTEPEPRHFTDKYKLPSHITFSDESVYSIPRNKGGRWVGDDLFMPSSANVERYPWLYKAYKPVSEEEVYHKFETGGPTDDELVNQAETYWGGVLPEATVTAPRIYDKWFERDWTRHKSYDGERDKSKAYDRWLINQGKLDDMKARRSDTSRTALGLMGTLASIPLMTSAAATSPLAFGTSIIFGQGTDAATKVLSDNKYTGWGNMMASNFGILPEFLWDFTNPGYYVGGIAGNNISKIISGNRVAPYGFRVRKIGSEQQNLNQLKNYRANILTRKTINRFIKDNPTLPKDIKENLITAAKEMRYEPNPKSGEFETFFTIGDDVKDASLTPWYQIDYPKYDRWSLLHELGHNVDDASNGAFSRGITVPDNYRYGEFDIINGDPTEWFADLFATKYSKGKKPYDYATWKAGTPWSLKSRVDLANQHELIINPNGNRKISTGITKHYKNSNIPVTDAEWDVAYNAALKSRNMDEVQRLRDLHFKIKAPNTKVIDDLGNPLKLYHGTTPKGDYILRNKGVVYKPNGLDMFFTSNYYGQYLGGSNTKSLPVYINAKKIRMPGINYEIGNVNPRQYLKKGDDALYEWGFMKANDFISDAEFENATKLMLEKEYPWAKSEGIDLNTDNFNTKAFLDIIQKDVNKRGIGHHPVHELAVPNGKQVKLVDAITYDDNGNIIPLSKRDNFKINDLRYALLPFIGGIGYSSLKKK